MHSCILYEILIALVRCHLFCLRNHIYFHHIHDGYYKKPAPLDQHQAQRLVKHQVQVRKVRVLK